MLICVGSQALKYHRLTNREPSDLDLIGPYREVSNYIEKMGTVRFIYPIEKGKKIVAKVELASNEMLMIEGEIAWKNSLAAEFLDLVAQDKNTIQKDGLLIPSIDVLYMLKMSHRYLKNSPFFRKTMEDIYYLRSLNAKIPEEYKEFYKKRKSETYNYFHPKLDVNKKDFFNGDGVLYVYDHDSIHEAVRHLEQPAYTYFKSPDAEVFCDKDLFFSLEQKTRLYAVLEEAYVLALERSQIPFRGKISPIKSFEVALEKICTSITSGWFREFAWENWNQVYEMLDEAYVEKFFQKADAGLVKKHNFES